MKKKYVKPEVEIVSIETECPIAASSWGDTSGEKTMGFDDEEWDEEFD